MKRLYRVMGACFGILLVLCGSAVLIGRAQPQPAFLPELRVCGPTPCYMNIALGKTTRQEAEALINAVPGMRLDAGSRTAYSDNGPVPRLDIFSAPNNLIREVDLYPIAINVGDV